MTHEKVAGLAQGAVRWRLPGPGGSWVFCRAGGVGTITRIPYTRSVASLTRKHSRRQPGTRRAGRALRLVGCRDTSESSWFYIDLFSEMEGACAPGAFGHGYFHAREGRKDSQSGTVPSVEKKSLSEGGRCRRRGSAPPGPHLLWELTAPSDE